jgi:hypothetical protein
MWGAGRRDSFPAIVKDPHPMTKGEITREKHNIHVIIVLYDKGVQTKNKEPG